MQSNVARLIEVLMSFYVFALFPPIYTELRRDMHFDLTGLLGHFYSRCESFLLCSANVVLYFCSHTLQHKPIKACYMQEAILVKIVFFLT